MGNALSGTVPAALGSPLGMPKLDVLVLGDNRLTGRQGCACVEGTQRASLLLCAPRPLLTDATLCVPLWVQRAKPLGVPRLVPFPHPALPG